MCFLVHIWVRCPHSPILCTNVQLYSCSLFVWKCIRLPHAQQIYVAVQKISYPDLCSDITTWQSLLFQIYFNLRVMYWYFVSLVNSMFFKDASLKFKTKCTWLLALFIYVYLSLFVGLLEKTWSIRTFGNNSTRCVFKLKQFLNTKRFPVTEWVYWCKAVFTFLVISVLPKVFFLI